MSYYCVLPIWFAEPEPWEPGSRESLTPQVTDWAEFHNPAIKLFPSHLYVLSQQKSLNIHELNNEQDCSCMGQMGIAKLSLAPDASWCFLRLCCDRRAEMLTPCLCENHLITPHAQQETRRGCFAHYFGKYKGWPIEYLLMAREVLLCCQLTVLGLVKDDKLEKKYLQFFGSPWF